MLLGAFTDWKPERIENYNTRPEEASLIVEQWGGRTLPTNALPEWMRQNLEALKNSSEQVM